MTALAMIFFLLWERVLCYALPVNSVMMVSITAGILAAAKKLFQKMSQQDNNAE